MFGLKQPETKAIQAETTVDAYYIISTIAPHLRNLQKLTKAEAPRIADAAQRLREEINAHLEVDKLV